MTARNDPRLFEHLLERTGWMRSLARQLCADRAVADDIAQDAWLAALEHPPRDTGAARAWIARVIANLTHARQRGESARSARQELVARREEVSSTADVVERAEIGKKLAECVLALDEPYRSTVLSRYFDGLSAEEIAARERVSSSTVRTRLARGLALLRERLERRDGRTWMSAMALLSRAKPGAAAASAATAGAVASTQLVPVIVMSTLAKIGIGVALVGTATWFLWPKTAELKPLARPAVSVEVHPAPPEDPSAEASQRVAVATQSTPQPSTPKSPDALEPSSNEIDAMMVEIPPATIEGIVLRGRDPVEHCDVYAWPSWSPLPEHPERGELDAGTDGPWDSLVHATTDARGLFRFTHVHTESYPGFRYMVGADVGGGVLAETTVQPLADQQGQRIVIVLGSARIRGHVYDDDGKARAGARVSAVLNTRRLNAMRGFYTTRSTDASGAFDVGDLPAGDYWVQTYMSGRTSWSTQPDVSQHLAPVLRLGEMRTVDVGSSRRSPRWSGTVRTRAGDPVPGPFRILLQNRATSARFESSYDEQGRFQIPVRAGGYDIQVRLVGRYGDVKVEPLTMGNADLERDIIVPGTRVRVSAVDADTGLAYVPKAARVEVSMHLAGHDYPDAVLSRDLQSDGTCVIDGVGAGEWILSVRFVRLTKNDRIEVRAPVPFTPIRFTVLDGDVEVPVRIALHAP
jgi:RNA polymerase sigma factor (sigma-70 family)